MEKAKQKNKQFLKEFFTENYIPEHCQNLLKLYGIGSVQDLEAFVEEDIDSLEKCVRDGYFQGEVDFTSKATRISHFGADVVDVKNFRMRPLDRKKLLMLSAAAVKALEAQANEKLKKIRR